jgi:hypothetical protein
VNDNLIDWDGPNHLFATNLLNDLMVLLDCAAKRGLDPLDEEGWPIYGFAYWSAECAKALNVKKPLDVIRNQA